MPNAKPKVVWGNMVNLSGLRSDTPMKFTLRKNLDGWWHKDGNDDVTQLGLLTECGYIQFASTNRKEVELWTEGAKAVMTLLQEWSR